MQSCFAASEKASIEDQVKMTRYFKNIAITSIASYGQDNTFAGYKLLVRPVIYNKNNFKPFRPGSDKPMHELGKPFWTITGQQLPATEETCLAANADSCESNPADPFNTCYNSCVTHGPRFLFYDKNKKDLYILATTADTGQAGGMMLVYVANIETKSIKFLRSISGWIAATLSPSGKYLVFYGGSTITIYNLKQKMISKLANQIFGIKEKKSSIA